MSDDQSDQKQKEWERLEAMIAEAKRHQEIANAQKEFEFLHSCTFQEQKRSEVKIKTKTVS